MGRDRSESREEDGLSCLTIRRRTVAARPSAPSVRAAACKRVGSRNHKCTTVHASCTGLHVCLDCAPAPMHHRQRLDRRLSRTTDCQTRRKKHIYIHRIYLQYTYRVQVDARSVRLGGIEHIHQRVHVERLGAFVDVFHRRAHLGIGRICHHTVNGVFCIRAAKML